MESITFISLGMFLISSCALIEASNTDPCIGLNYSYVVKSTGKNHALNEFKIVESFSNKQSGGLVIVERKYIDIEKISEVDHFFISSKCGLENSNNTKVVFPVFDIARDRYRAVQSFFKERNIVFYTKDFSVEKIWVPKSCESYGIACQKEIDEIGMMWNQKNTARGQALPKNKSSALSSK